MSTMWETQFWKAFLKDLVIQNCGVIKEFLTSLRVLPRRVRPFCQGNGFSANGENWRWKDETESGGNHITLAKSANLSFESRFPRNY